MDYIRNLKYENSDCTFLMVITPTRQDSIFPPFPSNFVDEYRKMVKSISQDVGIAFVDAYTLLDHRSRLFWCIREW